MKKLVLIGLIISLILFLTSCTIDSYDIETQNAIDECNKLEHPDNCLAKLAVGKQDISICKKLSERIRTDNCLAHIGIEKQDASICKPIKDFEEKEWCYLEIAKTKNDVSYCDETESGICYSHFAVQDKDLSLCDNIKEGQYYVNRCYASVAGSMCNPDICPQIEDDGAKSDCYKSMAVCKKDESYCELVPLQILSEGRMVPSGSRIYCYFYAAKEMKDYTVCNLVEDKYLKDDCYRYIAGELKDSSICEYIVDESVKFHCVYDATQSEE